MSNTDYLAARFPKLAKLLPKEQIAILPTPAEEVCVNHASGRRTISIKHDNLTGKLYGGNKVRKLEYLLKRAADKKRTRIATFGTVGSNHALATALYARELGFDCTCFLTHQTKTPLVPATLNMHIKNGTEIVRYGGSYAKRMATLRKYLWGRNVWVVPGGGSSWLGAVGFVNAGLELAEQVGAGDLPSPDRVYVATGTMGTAAGLAVGLALAGLPAEVHAVRVSVPEIMNEEKLRRLIAKTALMLKRLDETIPTDLATRVRIVVRHDCFAGGYAMSDTATDAAVKFAREQMNARLETTYTGKAMAALLRDLDDPGLAGRNLLFWNTYNSVAMPVPDDRPLDPAALPGEFISYFD